MYDPMACPHDNEQQLDRRNYKKGTYAMPSHTQKKKNKKDTASQFTMFKLLKTPSVGIVTEHPTLYKCNQTLVQLLLGF